MPTEWSAGWQPAWDLWKPQSVWKPALRLKFVSCPGQGSAKRDPWGGGDSAAREQPRFVPLDPPVTERQRGSILECADSPALFGAVA